MPSRLRPAQDGDRFSREPRTHLLEYNDVESRTKSSLAELYAIPSVSQLERWLLNASARCTDCAVPTCVRDRRMPTTHEQGCSLNNPHEWLDLVAQGKLPEAVFKHNETTLLWGMYGFLCYAPCELGCMHSDNDSTQGVRSRSGAVSIKDVELGLFLWAHDQGLLTPAVCKSDTGKSVAVIGAGPAGLEAAHRLRLQGHDVTVFDALDKAGGLMRYEIPSYKMPKTYLDFTIDLYRGEGINFALGQRITRPDQAEDLMRDFDAVILATGAPRARYEMRGSQADFKSHPQVSGASEFLEKLERGFDKAEESARRTLDGQNVVIVGNRLTAADVIGKSLRAGAQSISVIDWYPVSLNELAARSSSHEEIVAKSQAEPSRYSIFDDSVVAGLKDESGLLAVEVRNKSSGHVSTVKAHHVVMAIGYEGADPTVHELFGLSLRNGATVEADRYFGETRVPKLFCAGDNVHGASVLVDAGAMGARVGEAVHLYLNGQRPDITALMPNQVIQLDRNQPRTFIPLNVIR